MSNLPQVFQVTPAYLPQVGGKESYIHNIVTNLPEFRFVILTGHAWGRAASSSPRGSVRITAVWPPDFFGGPFSLPYVPGLGTFFAGVGSFVRMARQRRKTLSIVDAVVHTHWSDVEFLRPLSPFVRGQATERVIDRLFDFITFSQPTVFTDHSMFTQRLGDLEHGFLSRALLAYDAVVCVEREGMDRARTLASETGAPARIEYIPNSVDTDRFRPADANTPDELTIGFIGRANKGHDLILELCRQLPSYRFLLSVAGDRRSLKKWHAIASDRIRILENVPPWRLPDVLRQVQVVANPILYNGISRVTLESLASGVPVVAARGLGRYPLVDGKTGRLVDPVPMEFKKAIEDLFEDEHRRFEFARQARRIVEAEFSNRVIMPKIAGLYRSLA